MEYMWNVGYNLTWTRLFEGLNEHCKKHAIQVDHNIYAGNLQNRWRFNIRTPQNFTYKRGSEWHISRTSSGFLTLSTLSSVWQLRARDVRPVNITRSIGPSSFWSANLMAASRWQDPASSSQPMLLCLERERERERVDMYTMYQLRNKNKIY